MPRLPHPRPDAGPLTPTRAYRWLTAAGVDAAAAAVLARSLYEERRRLEHHARNVRPKACPQCAQVVQAGNLARHRRTHVREYAGRAA